MVVDCHSYVFVQVRVNTNDTLATPSNPLLVVTDCLLALE